MKQIIWSKQADADFDQAYRHASELGQNHADRLLDRLDEAHATLARYPPAGVMMANSGFRKWLLRPLPYGLLYEVQADSIRIIRQIYLRADWLSLA